MEYLLWLAKVSVPIRAKTLALKDTNNAGKQNINPFGHKISTTSMIIMKARSNIIQRQREKMKEKNALLNRK